MNFKKGDEVVIVLMNDKAITYKFAGFNNNGVVGYIDNEVVFIPNTSIAVMSKEIKNED